MKRTRINIYLEDPEIRRQVKTAAAKKDMSVSRYCMQAIMERIDGEESGPGKQRALTKVVQNARRFQSRHFGSKIFSVSSADLIRDARKRRS